MYGSDQMYWPDVIEPSIESVNDAPFLSFEENSDIVFNNVARFLELGAEEVTRHHAQGRQ
ncbi:MAG: hypothetical protein R3348_01980 [Xanthomonadales bacterium]|nr:hypothetical protein [Xanthomonadales bacterium]